MFVLTPEEKRVLASITHLMRQLSKAQDELAHHADEDKINVDYISGKAMARIESAKLIEDLFDLAKCDWIKS